MTYYIISMILFASSLLTAIGFTVRKLKVIWNSRERIIVILLFTTLLFESIASYILARYWTSPARVIDLLSFISVLFIIYWFYLYLKSIWLLLGSIFLVITAFSIDLFFNLELKTQMPTTSIAIAIVTLSSVFALMKTLLLSDVESDFKKLKPFWISMGLLVFQVTSMTMILFLPKLSRMDWELNLVISFMNMILYGCIAYALSLNETYE
jgi:hypothetical protein